MSSFTSESIDSNDESKLNALNLEFYLEQIITEDTKKILYAVMFCDILPGYHSYFASVGGNSVKIYKILDDSTVQFIYGFLDEDVDEDFCCCAWCATAEGIFQSFQLFIKVLSFI